MSKFIDADRLRVEIEFAKSVYDNPKRVVHGVADAFMQDGRAAMCHDILKKIDSLQQEQPDPKELPTLRQAIEEYMYDQLVRKIPEFKAGRLELKLSLQASTVKKLKKDYEQNGIPATAVGKVFTNTDPMNLYVESDKWNAILGQFENGQLVRIILVKEDAE